jgi:hypothetical protein
MVLLLKLAVAHFLGDFPLQPNGWAARKREPGILIRHLAVHAALLALVVMATGPTNRMWLASAGLLAVHGIIDWIMGGRGEKTLSRLLVDQTLHAASIFACFAVISPSEWLYWEARLLEFLSQTSPLAFMAGGLVSVWVGRYLIGGWIALVAKGLTEEAEGIRHGLSDAGARIGMLERLLIFLALVFRLEILAGFVIGVKALLRLPEATESKSRALAEYFILGTLASAAWAVMVALLTRALMEAKP